ncbi:MAG: hypothetical protein AB1489_08575 [Acidobacteriota bacterium]
MSITLSQLAPRCPQCGAAKIVYSCEPKCCFNHVCGVCRASFQLHTQALNAKLPIEVELPVPPELESCLPTTQCVCCESLQVFQLAGSNEAEVQIVCNDCRALLALVCAVDED